MMEYIHAIETMSAISGLLLYQKSACYATIFSAVLLTGSFTGNFPFSRCTAVYFVVQWAKMFLR